LLSEILENGGIQVEADARDPFNPQAVDWNAFEYSEKPVKISEFIKKLNICCPRTMKRVGYLPFLQWMEENDILEKVTEEEIKKSIHYIVGRRAAEIGVYEGKRIGKNGDYTVVLYSKEAQKFLLSHLEDIFHKQQNPANRGKRWEPEDKLLLLSLWDSGVEISQIAKQLQRSPYAIRKQLEKLIIERVSKKALNEEEKEKLNAFGHLLTDSK